MNVITWVKGKLRSRIANLVKRDKEYIAFLCFIVKSDLQLLKI